MRDALIVPKTVSEAEADVIGCPVRTYEAIVRSAANIIKPQTFAVQSEPADVERKPTPRSDEFYSCYAKGGMNELVAPMDKFKRMYEFAQQLEQQLALANARIDYLMSPDSSSPEDTTIWNEAIEAAAAEIDSHEGYEGSHFGTAIRKLKRNPPQIAPAEATSSELLTELQAWRDAWCDSLPERAVVELDRDVIGRSKPQIGESK